MSTTETSGKTDKRPAQHRAMCSICKHPKLKEIETRYLEMVSERKLAAEFDVSDDAIHKHVDYFGLNLERKTDTKKVLAAIISKGYGLVSQLGVGISERLLIDAVKEYDKITGQHVEAMKNPNDIEKAKEILDFHREHSKDFTEQQVYTLLIKPVFPQISAEQLQIKEEVSVGSKGDEAQNPL